MIAVYYNTEASPFTMYSVKVNSADYEEFLKAIAQEELPEPSGDVMFLENDSIVEMVSA